MAAAGCWRFKILLGIRVELFDAMSGTEPEALLAVLAHGGSFRFLYGHSADGIF